MTPERWLRLEVFLPSDASSPEATYALTECLVAAGSSGVQIDGDRCVTYFSVPQHVEAFKADVAQRARNEVHPALTLAWSWQPHEEWAELWRQGFKSHLIGERLSISPPWIANEPDAGRAVVIIDPGVAFGTAEHGSTRSCLVLLERHLREGVSILDVGAGSGVLAIASLKLGAATAVCVEVDAMACEALRENAERNEVSDQTEVLCDAFSPAAATGPFDVVMCNMVRARLLPILPDLVNCVASAGRLVVGGVEEVEREDFAGVLAALGPDWDSIESVVDEGWVAFTARRA